MGDLRLLKSIAASQPAKEADQRGCKLLGIALALAHRLDGIKLARGRQIVAGSSVDRNEFGGQIHLLVLFTTGFPYSVNDFSVIGFVAIEWLRR